MYVDPRWELVLLGEEANGGALVKTPSGDEVMIPPERLTNYAKVGNKLIPKNDVEWL